MGLFELLNFIISGKEVYVQYILMVIYLILVYIEFIMSCILPRDASEKFRKLDCCKK